MGLISTLKASGFIDRLVVFSTKKKQTVRGAETRIFGAVGAAVLLTCHSIVAILTVSEFVSQLGERVGISRYRRANLLSLTVSTFPFILPYFIPVILTANITNSGAEYGIPVVSPLQAGLYNFNSWAVLAMVLFAIVSGFGTNKKDEKTEDRRQRTEDR
jgi:Na+/H+ antiporter NhaC